MTQSIQPQPWRRSVDAAGLADHAEPIVMNDPIRVTRCLLCGEAPIAARVNGRFVTTACPACGAILAIEFDPPDEPGLRARIERLDEPE
jgi:hypothetical protein